MERNLAKILRIEDLEKAEKELINGRITGIQLSKTATISTAPYENSKPGYGMSIDTQGMNSEELRTSFKIGNKMLDSQMRIEAHNKLAERLEQDNNIGYYLINDIAYARVSSICSFDLFFPMPDFELKQYACRGKIAEAIFCSMLDGNVYPEDMEKFCREAIVIENDEEKDLHEDYAILVNGSLGLTIECLSIRKQYEQVKDHMTDMKYQVRVINDEHLYAGTADIFCKWDGVPGCFDIKATANLPGYEQVALYAGCEPGTKLIGYIPIGKVDTKKGYKDIKMTDDMKGSFKEAIKKRNRFYKRFGF
jgi:hypothetical protein